MHTSAEDVSLILDLARVTGGPILEVGCGTGRCLIPIIRKGYDTVGLDSSDAMLRQLHTKLKREPDEVRYRATPIQAEGQSFVVPLRFGLAFAAANSFTHYVRKDQQERFVENVFHHLRPGGLLIIDVFNPSHRQRSVKGMHRFEVGDFDVEHEDQITNFAEQTITVRTTVRRQSVTVHNCSWTLRYVFRFELEHLLEKNGFEIEEVWGSYDKKPFDDESERLFVVARKPRDADMTVIRMMQAEALQPA